MAAKSKYTPANVKLICDAIEETGRDSDGWAAAGVGKDSFYRWLKEKPDFSDAITAAKLEFRSTSLPQLRTWARKGLKNTLQALAEGREIISTTTVSGIAPDGSAVDLETIQRKPAMVPINQAFQYVMGREIDLVAWLRQGVDLGVFPRTFVEGMVDEIDGITDRLRTAVEGRIAGGGGRDYRNPGVDPSIAIAAALGLADIATLPTALDAGQKQTQNMGKVTKNRR
jgi:hypothetical protein